MQFIARINAAQQANNSLLCVGWDPELEKIPASLARQVSESIHIPTIGIGAGNNCDGQVLVMHDMLGITTEFKPRFLRQYLNLNETITQAVQQYITDVRDGEFPNETEQY